jgi:hypothetical protein
MKRVIFVLALLAIAFASAGTAFAQIQGGTISGTVKDEQGGVLPGVTVTAQGVDATQTFITEASGEYRFLNLAPGPYKITAALQGFTTMVRDNVIVSVGRNVELPLSLKIAQVAETITVTGDSPVIDIKATGTSTNFTADELTRIPTSRDPFALMRSVPGVLVDRVNIGGNETGQQSNFASKGTRPQDAVWTMDGINITDMTATGASPSYYNYDNFEEIQVSTAGQDIKQPTGGMGLNLVVKRGTNQFHGGFRGYFDNESMEASNVPAELAATGTTHATSDHNKQISDYGYDIGGPILRDHAWFYNSYSIQDVRLVRRAGALVDRTQLKNPDVKLNWQATKQDMVSFLYFDGFKIKEGRSPGISGILFDAPTATFHQDNTYTDNPLHGLWKIADDRVINSNMFVSGKYAFFNNGFILDPVGGLSQQAGRNFTTATSYGSVSQGLNVRPQKVANIDVNNYLSAMGSSHDLKYGFGFRTVDAVSGTLWPGNGILAIENSPTDLRAQVFRQGYGGNRADYLSFYAGDTIQRGALTVDVGVRFDRQWGKALASDIAPNPAFPSVVPGVSFAGYDSPFTWTNVSPRAGVTYALDESRKTIARASFSRYAGQLETGTVGVLNPSSTAGSATYRWVDTNGDHFAQASEVDLTQFITAAGGFNPTAPTAVTSANVPRSQPERTEDLEHRRRRGAGAAAQSGRERELQLHADERSLRQFHRPDHAARGRDACRLRRGHGILRHAARRNAVQHRDVHPERREGDGGRQWLHDDQHSGLRDRLPRPRAEPGETAVEQMDGARRVLVEQRSRALWQRGGHLRHERQPDADAQRAAQGRRSIRAAKRRQRLGQRLHQREMADQRQRDVSGAVRDRSQRQRVRPAGLSVPALPAGHDSGAGRRLGAPGPGHTSDRLLAL